MGRTKTKAAKQRVKLAKEDLSFMQPQNQNASIFKSLNSAQQIGQINIEEESKENKVVVSRNPQDLNHSIYNVDYVEKKELRGII